MNSKSKLHGVIIFLIATFGSYAQFQPQMASLFDEHKNIKIAIYVSLSTYGVGLMAEYKLDPQNYVRLIRIIGRFSPLVGILVHVLFLILLFPLLGPVAFIIWALFMVEALIKSVEETLATGENDAVDEENGSNV